MLFLSNHGIRFVFSLLFLFSSLLSRVLEYILKHHPDILQEPIHLLCCPHGDPQTTQTPVLFSSEAYNDTFLFCKPFIDSQCCLIRWLAALIRRRIQHFYKQEIRCLASKKPSYSRYL